MAYGTAMPVVCASTMIRRVLCCQIIVSNDASILNVVPGRDSHCGTLQLRVKHIAYRTLDSLLHLMLLLLLLLLLPVQGPPRAQQSPVVVSCSFVAMTERARSCGSSHAAATVAMSWTTSLSRRLHSGRDFARLRLLFRVSVRMPTSRLYGDVMLCDDHHKLKYTSSDALNRSLALSEDPAYNPFEYYKNKRSVKPLGGLSRLSAEEEAELKLKAEAALEIHRRQVWKNTSAATPGVPSPAKRPRGSSPIVKSSAKPRTFEDLPAFVKELDDIVHLSNTAMPNIVVNTQQLLWFLRRS